MHAWLDVLMHACIYLRRVFWPHRPRPKRNHPTIPQEAQGPSRSTVGEGDAHYPDLPKPQATLGPPCPRRFVKCTFSALLRPELLCHILFLSLCLLCRLRLRDLLGSGGASAGVRRGFGFFLAWAAQIFAAPLVVQVGPRGCDRLREYRGE